MAGKALRLEVKLGEGESLKCGVFSDVHYDSMKCNKKRFHEDAKYIVDNGGVLLFPGDLFDAIIKSDRKRHTQSGDQFHVDSQLNDIVEYVTEGLLPYKDNIWFIGMGNHETAVLKYHQFDLVKQLVKNLNEERDKSIGPIKQAPYKGFFQVVVTEKDNMYNPRQATLNGLFFHGKGGSAPITKGMIDFNRISTTYVADVYLLGHKHQNITDTGGRTIYVNKKGDIKQHMKQFMATAGYHTAEIETKSGYSLSYESEQFNAPTSMESGGVIEIEPRNLNSNEELEISTKIYHLTRNIINRDE